MNEYWIYLAKGRDDKTKKEYYYHQYYRGPKKETENRKFVGTAKLKPEFFNAAVKTDYYI